MVQWYSGGTLVQWWYCGGTVVVYWWYSGGTVMVKWLYSDGTVEEHDTIPFTAQYSVATRHCTVKFTVGIWTN